MKFSQDELDRLEKICKGLLPDQIKNIVSAYYKEKLAKNPPKINKSYSYKPENKLSQCNKIQELVKIVSKKLAV